MRELPENSSLVDSALPEAGILMSRQALPVLEAAVAAAGAHLGDAHLRQVHYRPGRRITVCYGVRIGRGGGTEPATMVATAGGSIPEGSVLVESDNLRVGVWRYPNDPLLPGLRHCIDGGLLPALGASLGLDGPVRRVRTRSYRPTRRAVIEVASGELRCFFKVVRSSRLDELVRRHEAVAATVPAPRVLGADPDLGVLALEALGGEALRDVLADPAVAALPEPGALTALLDGLPHMAGAVSGPMDRLPDHCALLGAVVPPLRGRLDRLATAVAVAPGAPPAPAHGDFHAGQVLVRDGDPVGLIDVDGVGDGARADDLAVMLGFLFSHQERSGSATWAGAYGELLHEGFAAREGDDLLRPRVAAAMMGFATVPFISQQDRWADAVARIVAGAESWLGRTPVRRP